jgi:hypothetical protein
MNEMSAIAETLRILWEGGSWEAIRASAGAPYLVKSVLFFVLPSIVGVVAGIAHWRETPLAEKLGVPAEGSNAWTLRAGDRMKLGG